MGRGKKKAQKRKNRDLLRWGTESRTAASWMIASSNTKMTDIMRIRAILGTI